MVHENDIIPANPRSSPPGAAKEERFLSGDGEYSS